MIPRPMTVDDFVPLVGQDFILDCEPAEISIRLVEAKPLRDLGGGRPPFILVFKSPPTAMLIDGIYTMRCGQFGPAAIGIGSLVAPVDAEPGHYYYQSVFN